jgi:tRNA pseudouridine32 synthase / 23S rRNA pseudouridine746 synthase
MILWSDPDLLVINKPAGLLSTQDGYDPAIPTLPGVLQAEWGRVWLVHRLDKDTSGVMLFARNPEIHRVLNLAFQDRRIHKTYHSIVVGVPPWTDCSIDKPLRINGDRQHRTIIDSVRGKPARTNVKLLRQLSSRALVEVQPLTGYTHQIRAHLSAAGFPILSDPLYWIPGSSRPLIDPACPIHRTALHAWSIELTHPQNGRLLQFSAPYPIDFLAALDWLAA